MDELERWRTRGRTTATAAGEVFVVDVPPHEDHGRDPLLVLHGFPTCSADWRHVVEGLAVDRRVVLFDFVGFGLSAKPDAQIQGSPKGQLRVTVHLKTYFRAA